MTAQGARSAPLDLHEGIVDPRGQSGAQRRVSAYDGTALFDAVELPADPVAGCKRWPEHLRLLSSQGEVVRGRCRATNLCEYCARLAAVETSEMLLLDALEDAPTLYVVLTARELLDRRDCRRHLEQLRRTLRARWPDVRWACLVEFQRRGALHLNLLVKGVPASDREALHEIAAALWCSRVDAQPQAQFVGEVSDGGGLVRYIALHFLKPAQAPPIGWRGHRSSYSRSYLVRPASVMREEARASLREKRELRRQLERVGHLAEVVPAEEVAQLVEQRTTEALATAAATSWRLVDVVGVSNSRSRLTGETASHHRGDRLDPARTAGRDAGQHAVRGP